MADHLLVGWPSSHQSRSEIKSSELPSESLLLLRISRQTGRQDSPVFSISCLIGKAGRGMAFVCSFSRYLLRTNYGLAWKMKQRTGTQNPCPCGACILVGEEMKNKQINTQPVVPIVNLLSLQILPSLPRLRKLKLDTVNISCFPASKC